MVKQKTVLAKAKTWALKKKIFGAQAFFRYVIFCFAENLNQVSDDFVFKGGNLLWVYIGTPRATVDLDLITLEANSHEEVRKALVAASGLKGDIRFSLTSFKEVQQEGKIGCVATITYSTTQGATNRFDIDIVYAIETDSREIESPVHSEHRIRSATLENIVADKLAACHRYKAGNTRMKDFDDLWRLSRSELSVDHRILARLLKSRKIPAKIESSWISTDFENAWQTHRSRYQDLPRDLGDLFKDVNEWLAGKSVR